MQFSIIRFRVTHTMNSMPFTMTVKYQDGTIARIRMRREEAANWIKVWRSCVIQTIAAVIPPR